MNNKKYTGSYYTPPYLAKFITTRVINSLQSDKLEILEPSVGDGSFISELAFFSEKKISLTALDINNEELKKAATKWKNSKGFFNLNFLDFTTEKRFSAVLGNPPYIKKKLLQEEDLLKIKDIHLEERLSENSVNNIWSSFILKSCNLLKRNGIIAFVLPSELLQVKYAKEIREYLIRKFTRIEIFTFNDLMFECKGQDTIVLIGYLSHNESGQFFTNIESQEQLLNNDFILRRNELLVENDTKWSHHFLNEDELHFLVELKQSLSPIIHYANSKPGIVTAANNFFIIDQETERRYNLQQYTHPIIQRGLFVNGSVTFDNDDYENLTLKKLPNKFLLINNDDDVTEDLQSYLFTGEQDNIHKRYKCSIRKKWFVVPNVSTVPEAFFFKRAHLYPKLLKNNANAFVTDSAYKIEMRNDFNVNSFIFSFYNSLTLLFAELEGRYYGGGVLELIPSEFKKLPLPYQEIQDIDFERFVENFENKCSIEDILSRYNFQILNGTLGLNAAEIERIEAIRLKLVNKRTRK